MRPDLQETIAVEMKNAEQARSRGNEGMARVCARRAAGLVAQEFLLHQGVQLRKGSTFEALKLLVTFPGLPEPLHTAAAHLTTTVSPEFSLPEEFDLIADAHALIGGLG
jgi:hypothetical protein